MKAQVRAELASEVRESTPGDGGRLLTSSRARSDVGRWESEGGVASGSLSSASSQVSLPQGTSSQRRLLALANANTAGSLQVRIISRQSGSGFEWAGGLPDEPIDIRTYRRPPLQEDAIDAPLSIRGLHVDTGAPTPDECIRIATGQYGSYLYVLGEEESVYRVYQDGTEG